MGTEFLVFFVPVPLFFWAWNFWRIFFRQDRLHWILLLSGIVFIAFFCLPITTKQYFLQGLYFGGVLYIPFYLLMLAIVSILRKTVDNRIPKN